MGDCELCGKPAGFLRKKHAECEARRTAAINRLTEETRKCAVGAVPEQQLQQALRTARECHASSGDTRQALIRGWEAAVDTALEDGVLAPAEEHQLVQLQENLGLRQAELDQRGWYSRVAKAGVLRELMNGSVPNRVRIDGTLPVARDE